MSQTAPRVLIFNDVTEPQTARLRAAMPDAVIETCDTYEALPATLEAFGPDVVYGIKFGGTVPYPRDALFGPHGPGWISVGGSGCDHLGKWDADAVTVTNSAGVAAGMMAEYAFGSFLHFTLDIPGMVCDQKARHWNSARRVEPLANKTLLIVGLGQTGQAVAARAKALGIHVLGTRARPEPMENVDEVHSADTLPELWGRADLIVISVPLLPATRGMIGAEAFAAMKDTALLVDVSRGGVIDAKALLEALRTKRIRGAALDVFDPEPLPQDSPFWDLDNIILSPHCSAVYDGWGMASFEMFINNLKRWRRGEPLHNVVNPARGY